MADGQITDFTKSDHEHADNENSSIKLIPTWVLMHLNTEYMALCLLHQLQHRASFLNHASSCQMRSIEVQHHSAEANL